MIKNLIVRAHKAKKAAKRREGTFLTKAPVQETIDPTTGKSHFSSKTVAYTPRDLRRSHRSLTTGWSGSVVKDPYAVHVNMKTDNQLQKKANLRTSSPNVGTRIDAGLAIDELQRRKNGTRLISVYDNKNKESSSSTVKIGSVDDPLYKHTSKEKQKIARKHGVTLGKKCKGKSC